MGQQAKGKVAPWEMHLLRMPEFPTRAHVPHLPLRGIR